MPLPKPHYQPVFTAEQIEVARKVARQHSAPLREVLRARLTLVLAEHADLSHSEVARRAGLDYQTVYKWRRRWASDGWSLEDAPRSGRPRAFPPRADGGRESAGL